MQQRYPLGCLQSKRLEGVPKHIEIDTSKDGRTERRIYPHQKGAFADGNSDGLPDKWKPLKVKVPGDE